MKVSRAVIGYLVLAIGLIAIILVYNFVFTKNNEKTEEILKANETLQVRHDELEGYAIQAPRYKKEVKEGQAVQAAIISQFAGAVYEEDEIMFIDNYETEQGDMFFSSISYGGASKFADFSNELIKTNFVASEVPMSGNYEATYDGFKNFINHVKDQEKRTLINSISAAYNSTTGNLSGTVSIIRYVIDGAEIAYNPPYVSEITSGRTNIFGTRS